jgi:hypothetical protein
MKPNTDSPSERVKSAFQKLAVSAANLNNISDELGKSIEGLDSALKRLNLGVTAWVTMDRGDNTEKGGANWYSRDLGYAKIGGKWGIAIRTLSGDYAYPDGDQEDWWLFNDAPRWLRILAIDHMAALIEKLIDETNATAEKVKAKIEEARELGGAIAGVLPASPRKK